MFPPLYMDFFDLQPKKRECTPEIFPASTQKYARLVPIEPWFQAPRWISLRSTVIARERLDPWVSSGRPWRIPMGIYGNIYPPFLLLDVYGKWRWIYHIYGACGLGKIEESRSFWKWLSWGCQMNEVWPKLLIAEFCVVFLCSVWLCKHCLWQMTTSGCCCVCCCMDTVTRWRDDNGLIMLCFLVNVCVCLHNLLAVFVDWSSQTFIEFFVAIKSAILAILWLSFPSQCRARKSQKRRRRAVCVILGGSMRVTRTVLKWFFSHDRMIAFSCKHASPIFLLLFCVFWTMNIKSDKLYWLYFYGTQTIKLFMYCKIMCTINDLSYVFIVNWLYIYIYFFFRSMNSSNFECR